MLAGEDFGRREQRRLRARLDRGQHRQQRDQGLARADVALEQAQHRHGPAPCRRGSRRSRRRCAPVRRVGQLQLADQPPVALQRHAALAPRDLRGAASARAGWRTPRHKPAACARSLRAGSECASASAARQAGQCLARQQARLDPFGQARARAPAPASASSRMPLVGDALGQRIDRLAERRSRPPCRGSSTSGWTICHSSP